ncbi:MAG: hypothetical protein EBY49_08105, partial [Actinobacteria bacterium]|nr:hypothetical protein [Actinomycetota bacterium]
HGFLYLAPRRLILLQNPQRVAQLCIGPLQTLVRLHQVALHVAFAKPIYLSSDEIPADDIEKERLSLLEITKAEGKPEQAWDKIVTGRLNAWKGERALLEQGLHGDKTAVKDSLGGGNIARFVQVVIGS